ncbi:MAG: hypothetical protein ABSE64_08170 [Vulcanimicrobiaceae bacterium]
MRLPLMVQDPMTAPEPPNAPPTPKRTGKPAKALVKGIDVPAEADFRDFLDGPITPKVAILDFDPKSGLLVKGARFLRAPIGKKRGTYNCDESKIYSDTMTDVLTTISARILGTRVRKLETCIFTRTSRPKTARPLLKTAALAHCQKWPES